MPPAFAAKLLIVITHAVCIGAYFAPSSPWPFRGRSILRDGRNSAAVGPTTATLRWSWHLGYCFSSSPVIGSDGSVYIGASSACYPPSRVWPRRKPQVSPPPSPTFEPFPGDGNLWALNGSTGAQLWSVLFPTPSMMGGSAAVVVGGGGYGLDAVYAPSGSSNEVFALRSNGAITHVFPLGQHSFSSPAVSAAGVLYVGADDNYAWAYNVTGALLWRYETQNTIDASPALSPDESLVYFPSNDFTLYAIDALSGSLVWSFATGGYLMASPAVDSATGVVYIPSCDNNLYALNGTTGARLWAYATGWDIASSPALSADGTVIFGGGDNLLRALDKGSGALVWELDLGGQILSSPAVDAQGNVFIGSSNFSFFAVNGTTGTPLWRYDAGNAFVSSPAIAADGTVVVGGLDGTVYAWGPGTAPQLTIDTDLS